MLPTDCVPGTPACQDVVTCLPALVPDGDVALWGVSAVFRQSARLGIRSAAAPDKTLRVGIMWAVGDGPTGHRPRNTGGVVPW